MRHLLLIGVSHHSAPVEVRERLDFSGRGLEAALETLVDHHGLPEAVVLSTCNRAEVYASCSQPDQARLDINRFLSDWNDLPDELLTPHLYELVDQEATRHLFRVAAGLDSLVVGEPQILGQVKDAYSLAADQARTGALLNRLFHSAFSVGKRVRTDTTLGEGAVSVSYAAVALARKIFGRLEGLNVLLLGAGEMGKLTAQHLRSQHVARIVIASRTARHAEALAAEIGAECVPWTDLEARLADADIVITATGSTQPIVSRAGVETAMFKRFYKPLFLIDIAVPRDVDPAVSELEQVFVYNIDDLRAIVDDNVSRRQAEVERAEAIVAQEVAGFTTWLKSRHAVPTVIALRKRFEDIRLAELARLNSKMANLPPEAQNRVDEVTRLIIEKLLHTPTEQLKALPDHATVEAYSDALSRLFDLSGSDTSPRATQAPEDDSLPRPTDRKSSVPT